ncbi:MAG TPA: valine--tRNA ligase, partial [Candidatus Limnocylindrales bacterium]|nr:valine--tRNA ligase [Candidatus Limnocylindrales bacterium]
RTSVSDLEVIPTQETGTLWTIRYHLIDERSGLPNADETITVATTRPETILGDTAVAVHPDDDRYRALVGRRVRIPFVDRDVPIIADDVVDRGFGTGAVKITPAHDKDDHATGQRHGLPMISVLADDATINEVGGTYAGLDRYEARKRIVADLEGAGDLVGTKPHEMVIGRCQRSNDVIEPRLKTQWFIKVDPLAQSALQATRSGETEIMPARFEKVWENWLTNIHDWNVSRQLWWGHRIPAWYCPDGHVTVSSEVDGPARCETCGRGAAELRQDPDVFDTWYSSGLWPFSTLGWPDRTEDLRRYYPGTVMETGYDIIFFWVARMMFTGLQFMDAAPFRTVYLHGMVKDPYGQKMSKSKGNIVDPLEAIDRAGADAMRFSLLNGTSPGNDQKFSNERLEDGRNFANKLWNATRFVLGARPASIPADAPRREPDEASLGAGERWIRSRTAAAVDAVDKAMGEYQLAEATRALYDGIWSEFCDWGVELAKVRLADEALPAAVREATWWTLVESIDTFVRLLHPVMPFITEALWASLPHAADDPDLLIVAAWPQGSTPARDRATEASVEAVLDLVRRIRNARTEAGIETSAWIDAEIAAPGASNALVAELRPQLERLTRVKATILPADVARKDVPGALSVIAGGLEAYLQPREDPEVAARERDRLTRELGVVEGRLASSTARLADPAFSSKAPPHIVDGARRSHAELEAQAASLREKLAG